VLDASGRGVLPLLIALTGDPAKVITIADLDAAQHSVRFSTEIIPIPEVMAQTLLLFENSRLRMPIETIYPFKKLPTPTATSTKATYSS
jgi:hypothetical protein